MGRPPSFTYMAPEIYNRHFYTTSADIYSFGLVLYFIMTSIPPFHKMEGAEAASRAAKANIRPVFPENIPTFWKQLISSCWHRHPDKRPTAHSILQSIYEFSSCLPTSSPNPNPSYITEDSPFFIPSSLPSFPPLSDLPCTSLLDISFLKVKDEEKEKEEKYLLKSGGMNNHSALLVFQLASIVNNPKYSDLTISVGEKTFHAHKAIIAARNENMAVLIEQSRDSNHISIDAKHISPNSFQSLLEFLYSGVISVTNENVFELMEAANQLNIQQVVDICRGFIDDHGIPVTIIQHSARSEPTTTKFKDVKETLINVESGIQSIESALEILTRKLERVAAMKPSN